MVAFDAKISDRNSKQAGTEALSYSDICNCQASVAQGSADLNHSETHPTSAHRLAHRLAWRTQTQGWHSGKHQWLVGV